MTEASTVRSSGQRPRSFALAMVGISMCSLFALAVVWFDAYFYFAGGGPEPTYRFIGHYSLFLAIVSLGAAAVSSIRGRMPWGALASTCLAWVSLILNTGREISVTYYVLIVVAVAAAALVLTIMVAAHRRAWASVALTLALPSALGLARVLP